MSQDVEQFDPVYSVRSLSAPSQNLQIQLRVKFCHFLCGTQRFYVMTSERISSLLKSPILI